MFIGDELIIDNMGLTGLHPSETVYSDPYTLKGKRQIAIYWSEREGGDGAMVQFEWKLAIEEGLACFPDSWKLDLGSGVFYHNPSEEKEP